MWKLIIDIIYTYKLYLHTIVNLNNDTTILLDYFDTIYFFEWVKKIYLKEFDFISNAEWDI